MKAVVPYRSSSLTRILTLILFRPPRLPGSPGQAGCLAERVKWQCSIGHTQFAVRWALARVGHCWAQNIVPTKQIRPDKAVDIPLTGASLSFAALFAPWDVGPCSNLLFPVLLPLLILVSPPVELIVERLQAGACYCRPYNLGDVVWLLGRAPPFCHVPFFPSRAQLPCLQQGAGHDTLMKLTTLVLLSALLIHPISVFFPKHGGR